MRPIFYDTETTGVRPEKDRIIEIAAYDPATQKSFVSFIKIDSPIPPDATAIHQITDEMIKEAPLFPEVIDAFTEFCGENCLLIAHNNDGFDRLFLQSELNRHQKPLPAWKFLDSLKWARKYRRDLPRHSLQSLREVYNLPANQAHRALNDVITLHQVFSAMTGDLPIETIYQLINPK